MIALHAHSLTYGSGTNRQAGVRAHLINRSIRHSLLPKLDNAEFRSTPHVSRVHSCHPYELRSSAEWVGF